MLQRDAFIEEIIKNLKHDKSIFFLSADFGASALDRLRKDFPNNFLQLSISEIFSLPCKTHLNTRSEKMLT